MMSRRRFLACSATLALTVPALARHRTEPSVRLGLIADAQYADLPSKGTRFYRNSLKKLEEAVLQFNQLSLGGIVNLGDLIDRKSENFDPALLALKHAKAPLHHVLGNHDFVVDDALKAHVPRLLGLRRGYYSWNAGSWCFVVLDTNEISTYSHPEGTKEHAAAAAELTGMQSAKLANAQTWNGRASEKQMKWFESVCRKARRASRSVVVFAHHPVFPADQHNVWNDSAVLGILRSNTNVVAWINGHNHAGDYGEYEGVHCLTLKGMVETTDQNAFAVSEFSEGKIKLTGYGRESSREFKLRQS
jgi:3',5'-cyclic AMP phosphodiesterase CpdA